MPRGSVLSRASLPCSDGSFLVCPFWGDDSSPSFDEATITADLLLLLLLICYCWGRFFLGLLFSSRVVLSRG